MLRRAGICVGVTAAALAVTFLLAGCGGGGTASQWQMMRLGPGMMGYVPNGTGTPIQSLSAARRQARRFAQPLGLTVGEVMQFTNNYYAELVGQDGKLATEALVDPGSGATWIEYGPAMMWNTKYGMMSGFVPAGAAGMMGGGSGMMGGGTGGMMGAGGMMSGSAVDPTYAPSAPRGEPAVGAAEARQIAGRWLGDRAGGLAVGTADAFPGYYTLHVLRDGKVAGMLSVNAYTGAVWYHWWHGGFVSMQEA